MVWHTRVCGEDLYHHIYAWGNDRHPTFKKPAHYHKYLILLEHHARRYEMAVLAYALMDWHVHLFIYDAHNNLSEFMKKIHGDYAQYFNRSAHQVGHVFKRIGVKSLHVAYHSLTALLLSCITLSGSVRKTGLSGRHKQKCGTRSGVNPPLFTFKLSLNAYGENIGVRPSQCCFDTDG